MLVDIVNFDVAVNAEPLRFHAGLVLDLRRVLVNECEGKITQLDSRTARRILNVEAELAIEISGGLEVTSVEESRVETFYHVKIIDSYFP
jgi:hypothetical protein